MRQLENTKYRKMKIVFICAIMLILYSEVGIFKQYLLPITIMRLIVLLIPPLLLVISSNGIIIKGYEWAWIATLPFLFINNIALKHGYTINVACHVGITLFYFGCRNNDEWIGKVWKIIKVFSIIYAICTFWFILDKGFYNRFIFGLFTAEDQASLLTNNKLGYAAGLTGHYSHNAMYLTLGTGVFAAELLMKKEKMNINISALLGFLLCFIALLSTGKRGPTIFAVCSLGVMYYCFTADKPRGRLIKMIFIGALIISGLYILASFFPQVMLVLERVESARESGNLTNGRDLLTNLALDLFKTKPVFGIGWYGFRYIHIQEYPWFPYMVHVHNVYIQLLCETGVVGFALYMIFFIGSYANGIKILLLERKERIELPNKAKMFLSFSVFIQTFFLLYSFTGNPLYDVMIQFPYLMFCSVPVIYTYLYIDDSRYRGRFNRLTFRRKI